MGFAASAAAVLFFLYPTDALARRNGFQGVCSNCHGPGADVTLTLDPPEFEPGQTVRLTVEIAGNNPNVGGVDINMGGRGTLQLVDGGGVRLIGTTAATHDGPKSAQGGVVTFLVDWVAPVEPAAINIEVWAVGANNDGNRSGDGSGEARVSKVAGCLGATFYRDYDGDGYGSSMFGTTEDCAPPAGFALLDGDCNEDLASINPGMTELCNGEDDNCNARVDERAFPTCGIGWCRRSAQSCGDQALCVPGDPVAEACNGLDDDCDGWIDQGDLCGAGMVCQAAVCKTLDEATAADPAFVPYEGTVEEGLIPEGTSTGAAGSGSAAGGSTSMPEPSNGGSTTTPGAAGSTSMPVSPAPGTAGSGAAGSGSTLGGGGGSTPGNIVATGAPKTGCAMPATNVSGSAHVARWSLLGILLLGLGVRRRAVTHPSL